MTFKKRYPLAKYLLWFMLTLALFSSSCKIIPDADKQTNKNYEYPDPPNRVENLEVPNVTTKDNSELTLKWGYVNNADGYYVYYLKANEYSKNDDFKLATAINDADTTSHTFTNLEGAERYVFMVKSYKIVPNGIKFSEQSELVESATKPTLTLETEVENKKVTLKFATSPRDSVLKSGDEIYSPLYDIYSSDPTLFNETNSNPIATFSMVDTPQYIKTTEEKENSVTTDNELKSNSTVKFQVYMNIQDSPIQSTKQEKTIDYPPEYYPSTIFSSNQINAEKNKITVSFTASPINDGLEAQNIEQYFDIKKTNLSTEKSELIISHKTFQQSIAEGKIRKIDELNYEFVDTDVKTNNNYQYTITPWYMLTKENDLVIWYECNNPYTTEVSYSRSIPYDLTSSLIIPDDNDTRANTDKNKFLDNNGNAEYRVNLNWKHPHTEESTTYNLHRLEFAPNTSSPKDIIIQENINADTLKYEDKINLTKEQDKSKWEYRYYLTLSEEDNNIENHVYADNKIETTPSVKQIDFVTSFTASNENENATNITLHWNLVTEEDLIKETGDDKISIDKIKFSLARTKATLDGYKTIISDLPYNTLSYKDENLEDGTKYFYMIEATYKDENSSYNGQTTTLKVDDIKTLGAVKSISASESTSSDYIEINFETVSQASSYIVEYAEDTNGTWNNVSEYLTEESDYDNGILFFNKDARTQNAGKSYFFRIKSVDKNGISVNTWCNTNEDGKSAIGSIFGSYGFTIIPSSTIYSDRIKIDWNSVKGATRYEVKVFADENLTKVVHTNFVTKTSFTFEKDFVNDSMFEDGYSLSRPYFFRVIPIHGSDKVNESFIASVKASWLFPPKNITATRSISRYSILVSWDEVEGTEGYNIYRRIYGKEMYEYLSHKPQGSGSSFEDLTASESIEYEYTVSSVNESIESEVQTYFGNKNNNIGCLLSPPTQVTTAEGANNLYSISFKPSLDVDGYVINTTKGSYTLKTSDINNVNGEKNTWLPGDISIRKDNNGNITRVTYFFDRPIVISTPLITVNINSYKTTENESRNSNTVSIGQKTILTSTEIVNLVNTTLTEIIYNFNLEIGGDWWGNGFNDKLNPAFRTGDQNGALYIQTETSNWIGACNDDGYMRLKDYYDSNTLMTLSTTEDIALVSKNGGAGGYLGTDPLNYIGGRNKGKLTAILPYDLGVATIQYNSVKADGSDDGEYKVTYNDKTEIVKPSSVHSSVRNFLSK